MPWFEITPRGSNHPVDVNFDEIMCVTREYALSDEDETTMRLDAILHMRDGQTSFRIAPEDWTSMCEQLGGKREL